MFCRLSVEPIFSHSWMLCNQWGITLRTAKTASRTKWWIRTSHAPESQKRCSEKEKKKRVDVAQVQLIANRLTPGNNMLNDCITQSMMGNETFLQTSSQSFSIIIIIVVTHHLPAASQTVYGLKSSWGSSSFLLRLFDWYLCVVVFRPVGGAQTSVRCHGELGPERLCGAEDPAGCWGFLLILSDGADHGGRPRNLPSGIEIWLKYEIHD